MKKINIAELLKYCPKGMELDCTMYDDTVFYGITDDQIFPIRIKRVDGGIITLTKYGEYSNCPSCKCVIFPKGKTTWEGFVPPCQFKDGDVISDSFGSCIFKGEGRIKGTVDYYCGILAQYFHVKDSKQNHNAHYGDIVNYRLATEEEKAKLFQTIKDNGYKWNAVTKTLEKLIIPKFKVGDRIRHKKAANKDDIYEINKVYDDSYGIVDTCELDMKYQDNYELVLNKFDIKTLKPFDKVLVRDGNKDKWNIDFFSYYRDSGDYQCMTFVKNQCIPYENNEHLLNTKNDCDDFYKIWE